MPVAWADAMAPSATSLARSLSHGRSVFLWDCRFHWALLGSALIGLTALWHPAAAASFERFRNGAPPRAPSTAPADSQRHDSPLLSACAGNCLGNSHEVHCSHCCSLSALARAAGNPTTTRPRRVSAHSSVVASQEPAFGPSVQPAAVDVAVGS